MGRRFVCALFSVFLLASLAGCGLTRREIVLEPSQVGTKISSRAVQSGACFNLDRSIIISHLTRASDQLAVGYENNYVPGADPFPCNHRYNYSYQAAMQFDLSELIETHAVVVEAVLEIPSVLAPLQPVTETTRDCRMHLEAATEAWAGGDFSGDSRDPRSHITTRALPGDPATPYIQGGRDHPTQATVTRTVIRWLSGRMENNGFVFLPPTEHVFADEILSCVYLMNDPKLKITVLERPASP